MNGRSDFVVVANRLPVDQVTDPDGSTRWQRSPGGLVTALEPFVAGRGGAWVGLVRLGRARPRSPSSPAACRWSRSR